jgi:antirestriction protein ArdC
MRIAEKHIRHYNRLNGNLVTKKALVKFHAALKKDIDSRRIDAHVPFGVECIDIEKKLAKAIKRIGKDPERIELKPISLNQKHYHPHQSPFNKKGQLIYGIDQDCLAGLECDPPEAADEPKGLGFTREGQQKIYDMVTEMILETMKSDGLFWREPWAGGGKQAKKVKVNVMGPLPVNFVSKAPYSGVNYWLLKYVAPHRNKYTVLNYMTITQVNQLGGKIKKGAKAWPVIYYSLMYKHNGKNITEDQYETLSEDEQKKVQKIPFIQYYRVFNAHDIEGVPGIMEQVQARKTVLQYEVEPIKAAESIVNEMPKRPYIQQSKQRKAYYSPGGDFVHMPYIGVFDKEQQYYSTFFHELVHSTGHESRLGRDFGGRFGDKKYAFEELIAELGASYLCAESGILYFTLKSNAAYLKSWSKKLREEMKADNKFFLKAAAKAQQASDFILGDRSRGKKTEVVEAPKSMRESKSARPPVQRKERSKATAERSKKTVTLNGLSGADQLTAIQFYEHDLGPFKKEFHRLNSDSNVMIWGQPGHGKTVKLLQLAQHFAANGKKVLYIAEEEYGKSTLAEKLTTFKIGHPNLSFAGELVEDHLAHFDVIFFDSVNSMGLTSHDVKRLDRKYPNKLFFLIVQTTKEGDFRGGRDWEHIVDIAGEIRNRKLILRKNRLDSNFKTKADKLMVDALVEEKKQKEQIKKLVKEQTEPAEPVTA